MYRTVLMLISVFLLLQCHKTTYTGSKKTKFNGNKILYGKISYRQLFDEFPDWRKIADNYIPDSLVIAKLINHKQKNIKVDIFLGTWCKDSRRDVPALYKVWKESAFTDFGNMNLYALDRNKRMQNNYARLNNIQRIATFIFKKENREIGRIIEHPTVNLETDILNILKNVRSN